MFRREKEMRYICRMFKMENGTTCGQGHPYPTRNYCMFRLPAAAVGAPSNSFEHLSSVS